MVPENWLIVGLGNPGDQYRSTRHNLGFMLVDRLAESFQTQVRREECKSLIGRAEHEGAVIELAKPQTFMNLSGEAVSCLTRKSDRSVENLIVVSDDLALPIGRIRLRQRGSHGGQNGLRSIINSLGTDEFIRLRIGIAPDHPINDASSFVLGNFSKSEFETVRQVLDASVDAVKTVVRDGIQKAMAVSNGE